MLLRDTSLKDQTGDYGELALSKGYCSQENFGGKLANLREAYRHEAFASEVFAKRPIVKNEYMVDADLILKPRFCHLSIRSGSETPICTPDPEIVVKSIYTPLMGKNPDFIHQACGAMSTVNLNQTLSSLNLKALSRE